MRITGFLVVLSGILGCQREEASPQVESLMARNFKATALLGLVKVVLWTGSSSDVSWSIWAFVYLKALNSRKSHVRNVVTVIYLKMLLIGVGMDLSGESAV